MFKTNSCMVYILRPISKINYIKDQILITDNIYINICSPENVKLKKVKKCDLFSIPFKIPLTQIILSN